MTRVGAGGREFIAHKARSECLAYTERVIILLQKVANYQMNMHGTLAE